MPSLRCWLALSLLGMIFLSVQAQDLPACTERAHWTFDIRANPERYCVEIVWQDESTGEMGFTGLAFAPDGRLFAASPLQGRVLMLHDTDGDTQPDSPQVVMEDIDQPNSLLYTNGALYIAGGASLYRLYDDGNFETIEDYLPRTSSWNGGIATDGRWIYVGTGACDHCDDERAGAILRLPIEGGSASVYATGFRQPTALAWHEGTLWATDTTLPAWQQETAFALDELNRVEEGQTYGYPDCQDTANIPASTADPAVCDDATAPTLVMPTGSQPSALLFYTGKAFPHLEDKALMTLMGSTNRSDVRGYGLIELPLPPPEPPFTMEILLPFDKSITGSSPPIYTTRGITPATFNDMSFLNRRGVGVWPHHLYGLAISPEGWIYMSVGGGTILSLRPG